MRTLRGLPSVGTVVYSDPVKLQPWDDPAKSFFYEGFHESTPEEIATDAYVERTRAMFALDDVPAPGGPGYYEEPPLPPVVKQPPASAVKPSTVAFAAAGLFLLFALFGAKR